MASESAKDACIQEAEQKSWLMWLVVSAEPNLQVPEDLTLLIKSPLSIMKL